MHWPVSILFQLEKDGTEVSLNALQAFHAPDPSASFDCRKIKKSFEVMKKKKMKRTFFMLRGKAFNFLAWCEAFPVSWCIGTVQFMFEFDIETRQTSIKKLISPPTHLFIIQQSWKWLKLFNEFFSMIVYWKRTCEEPDDFKWCSRMCGVKRTNKVSLFNPLFG